MSLVVAVDESLRGKTYIVAAAVYEGMSRRGVNSMVRDGRRPEQSRIHFKAENDSRRRHLLTRWRASNLVRAWIYTAQMPGQRARDECMNALAETIAKADVGRLVIELGDPVRNQRDVRIIQPRFHAAGVDVAYSHEPPGSFPGLEVADGLAWAYGAGGEWRRMIWSMIEIAPESER